MHGALLLLQTDWVTFLGAYCAKLSNKALRTFADDSFEWMLFGAR